MLQLTLSWQLDNSFCPRPEAFHLCIFACDRKRLDAVCLDPLDVWVDRKAGRQHVACPYIGLNGDDGAPLR